MATIHPSLFTSSHTAVLVDAGDYIRRFRDVEKFAGYCRECRNYGRIPSCPPFGFDTDPVLSRFGSVYLLGTKAEPDESLIGSPKTPEDTRRLSYAIMAAVRRQVDGRLLAAESLWPGSLAFFAGPCLSCPEGECAHSLGRCPAPDSVRPPLEALGFDVAHSSAELLGIEMIWGDRLRLPRYFTFVSALMFPQEPEEGFFVDAGLPLPVGG